MYVKELFNGKIKRYAEIRRHPNFYVFYTKDNDGKWKFNVNMPFASSEKELKNWMSQQTDWNEIRLSIGGEKIWTML